MADRLAHAFQRQAGARPVAGCSVPSPDGGGAPPSVACLMSWSTEARIDVEERARDRCPSTAPAATSGANTAISRGLRSRMFVQIVAW